MYRAYNGASLGTYGALSGISYDPTEAAAVVAKAIMKKMKPEILGLVKTATNTAVNELKPKFPEIMRDAIPAALNELKPRIPELVDLVIPQIPKILKAAEPPLEEYLQNRLYPKIIRPLAVKELQNIGKTTETKVSRAAIGTGSIAVLGVIAYLILSRSKERKAP